MTKRIAYNSREFWATHAPVASPTLLETHYPKTVSGGAGRMGWSHRIKNAQQRFPELDWLKLTRGAPTPEPKEWPECVYETHTAPQKPENPQMGSEYPTTTEVLSDGSQRSDRLLEMSEAQAKNPTYLLEAHGFCPAEWELVSAKNNIWNVYSKSADGDGHDVSTLYASKITVKPLTSRFDLAEVIEAVKSVEPRTYQTVATAPGLLEIPLMDAHFGACPDGCYDDTAARILQEIEFAWEHIVFAIGSDLFHNDNFRSTTAKGTVVDETDFPRAWQQAFEFYETLIGMAIQHAEEVHLYYIKGNHDESMSWAFCHLLAQRFPQVTCDLTITERKVHRYENIAVGWTHGDKAVKDFDRIFLAEFPDFATASVKEVHTGHTHHEVAKDRFGVMVRTLSTGNPADKWHTDNGYVGANRRFQLFQYTETALEAVRYV